MARVTEGTFYKIPSANNTVSRLRLVKRNHPYFVKKYGAPNSNSVYFLELENNGEMVKALPVHPLFFDKARKGEDPKLKTFALRVGLNLLADILDKGKLPEGKWLAYGELANLDSRINKARQADRLKAVEV